MYISSGFRPPCDATPYSFMEIIGNCRVKITDNHESESDIDLARNNIDRCKIKNNNNDPIGDRFHNGSFSRGSSICFSR